LWPVEFDTAIHFYALSFVTALLDQY